MNCLIVLTLAVAAFAAPLEDHIVSVTQSTLGDYKLKIQTADLSRTEERLENGDVFGSYSYPDANGILHTIQYTAGRNGFVATGDLPLPIEESQEILAERLRHLEGLRLAKSLEVAPVVVAPQEQLVLPVQQGGLAAVEPIAVIQESPEVVAAKEAHFAAHREARARLGLP